MKTEGGFPAECVYCTDQHTPAIAYNAKEVTEDMPTSPSNKALRSGKPGWNPVSMGQ
jgi:hypothetical protein